MRNGIKKVHTVKKAICEAPEEEEDRHFRAGQLIFLFCHAERRGAIPSIFGTSDCRSVRFAALVTVVSSTAIFRFHNPIVALPAYFPSRFSDTVVKLSRIKPTQPANSLQNS